LATIKNIIQTVFNTQGASAVNRDLTTLARNQTRLGQSSASAGRAFSAQAAGLGGLVAAYAGAAATTFALQQAFDKLAKSAQALQTLQGLTTLAAESAIGGEALLKSIQTITKSQLTLFEAASQTNLALSAGFDTSQIEGLATVAIKASRALGRDLTDAMTRVVRGSAKMETELLDELGIYTKIEPATRAYAAAIGKTVSELTEYERRQAFVNGVIEEGTRKFNAINTTVPTAAESIEAFGAKMVELSTVFLGFLAESVAPLAEFLTNNFAASLGAVGAILALVASKGVTLLKAGFDSLAVSALASARQSENWARTVFGIADAARAATVAVQQLNVANIRGTQVDKNRLTALQTEAKTRALTRTELQESTKLIAKSTQALQAERQAAQAVSRTYFEAKARERAARALPAGAFGSAQFAARTAEINRAVLDQRRLQAAYDASRASIRAINPVLIEQTRNMNALTAATVGLRAGLAGIATAAGAVFGTLLSRLGTLSGLIVGVAGKVLFWVSMIQLFGSAIANFLGFGDQFESYFKNLGKTISSVLGVTKAKEISRAITGIVSGSLAEIEKTNAELANLEKFTFSQSKFYGIKIEIEKSKEDIIKEVSDILKDVSAPVEKSVSSIAIDTVQGALGGAALGFLTGGPKGALVGAIGGGVIAGITSAFSSDAAQKAVDNFGASIRAQYAGAFTDLNLDTESQGAAVRAISVLRDKYGAVAAVDPQARAFLKVNEQLVLESVKYVKNIELIGSIMAATGQTADTVSKNFNFDKAIPQIEGLKQAVTTISGIDITVAIQTDEAQKSFQDFLLSLNDKVIESKKLLIDWGIPDKNIEGILSVIREFGMVKITEELENANSEFFTLKGITEEVVTGLQVLVGNQERFDFLAVSGMEAANVFINLSGSIDGANNSLLRSGEVLRSVEQGIATSSLNLEQFEQKMGAAASAIASAEQELISANKQQVIFNKLLENENLDSEARKSFEAERDALSSRREILLASLPIYRDIYDVQKQQEESLKSQIQLTEFIREITPKSANALSTALEAYTKDAEFAQAKTITFVQTLANVGIEEGNILRENIKQADELNLTTEQRTRLLGATKTTADAIVKSLSLQEGITAKLEDDQIKITTILANGLEIERKITVQEAEKLMLSQQNVELTSLQAKLAEQLIFDSISLLSNQEAYLSKLKETNSLKQRELELSLAVAQEEGRKQEAAARFATSEFNLEKLEQSLGLDQKKLELAELQADTATKAIERQIDLQEALNSKRQTQLANEISSQQRVLAILQAQGEARELLVSIATPLDKQGSNEAAIFREQLNNRARILAQETVILELEAQQAREELAVQIQIAEQRKSQAALEVKAAREQFSLRSSIIEQELNVLRVGQELDKQKLEEQIRANEVALTAANAQSALQRDRLAAEQELELKKATNAANQLLEQINVIKLQDTVYTKFIENFNKIVTQLTGQGVADLVRTPTDATRLTQDITAYRGAVAETYTQIFDLQDKLLVEETTNNITRLANEEQLLNSRLTQLSDYQAKVITLAEQRAEAEKAAFLETLNQANATYSKELSALENLRSQQAILDSEYNDTRTGLDLKYVNSILADYERIQKAGQQLVIDFRKQITELDKETKLLGKEVITIRVQAEFDAKQAASQLQQQLAEADVSRLQAEIRLTDARADIKEIPAIEAAKRVNDLQKQILAKQEEIEKIRFAREDARLAQEQALAVQQFAQNKADIEARSKLAVQEATARAQSVKAQISALAEFLSKNADIWNAAIERLREVLQAGANAYASAILSEGTSVSAVTAGTPISADIGSLTSLSASIDSTLGALTTSIETNATAQIEVEKEKTLAFLQNKGAERTALAAGHESAMTNLAIQGQTEDALAKKRLQDAKDAGSASAKKAEEAAKKITEAYKEITDKLAEAARAVTNEIIDFVGGIVTSIAQAKVDQLQAQETQIQDSLTFATDRLNDVRSELEKSLSDEASQREQLIELTDTLSKSQKDYIASLGDQDKKVSENSVLYIEQLLKQKQAILELATTTRRSVALSKQDQALTKTVGSLQESLDSTTESRIRAEERLAATQGILQGVTDAVNASSQGLSKSLLDMRSAMIALQEITGIAGGAGIDINQIQKTAGLQKAFGDLSGTVQKFKEGVQQLSKVNGNYVSASGKVLGSADKINASMSTVSNVLGGAQAGFGIGGTIAAALGKSGFATQIGGAIGGALGSVLSAAVGTTSFLSGIAGSISSALGGGVLAGMFFNFALPVIGALIGALFAKTPKSGATGSFDETGTFGISSEYQQGGAKSAGLKDVITATFDSFFGSLDELGIQLSEEAKRFEFALTTRKKAMTAYYRDLERGIDMSESVSTAKEASEFFIDSFLKSFEKGDLIVESILPFATNLQNAIDNFATKVAGDRNYESFKRAIDFAIAFQDSISALIGPAISTAEAFDLITKAAVAAAATSAAYYTRFLKETENTFSASSKEYLEATAAIRKNALAQIGLAEVTNNSITSFASLREAMESIDVGAVLVRDALANIESALPALRVANLTDAEATDAITQASRIALDNLVGDINDSLTKGLSLLENPATEAVLAIEALTENSAERLKTLQGTYDQLLKEPAADANQLAKQQENILLSGRIASLELSQAIQALSSQELKAVLASDSLSDSIKDLVSTQLQAAELFERIQARNTIRKTAEELSQTLSDLSGNFISLNQAASSASSPGVFEVSKALGETVISDFAIEVSSLADNIALGTRVTDSFNKTTKLLRRRLDEGIISSTQYADSIALVGKTLNEYLTEISVLFKEFKQVISDLSNTLTKAFDSLRSAASDLAEAITSGVDAFGESSSAILKIYDQTLGNIASSGNKLFDLQDRAKSSYEQAAKAVRDFEKENKLSGKTSAQVAEELDLVKQKLQNTLGAGSLDFAGFVEFSRLSSQQRSLEIELRKLTETEEEYKNLIKAKEDAQKDLAFVETTILSLGDKLIDTRLKESEIIQQTQQAAIGLLKSQEELQTITELLAVAQFDLNQRRFDEESAIIKTTQALDTYLSALTSLSTEFSSILSDDFLSTAVEAAKENARAIYSALLDKDELQLKIDEAGANATRAVLALQAFASSFSKDFIPDIIASREELLAIVNAPLSLDSNTLPYSDVLRAQITDRFTQFNDDLIKYLDQDGLKAFYGENGIFSQFRNSLNTNLLLDGFLPLISSGGPLESFNAILYLVGQSLESLDGLGASTGLVFELFTTNIGTLVTGVGNLSAGMSAAVASLLIDEQSIISSSNSLEVLKTSIGTFTTEVSKIDVSSAISILTTDIPTTISDFVSNVAAIDLTSIASIESNIKDVVLKSLTSNIVAAFEISEAVLGDLVAVTVDGSVIESFTSNIIVGITALASIINDVATLTVSDSDIKTIASNIYVTLDAVNSQLNNIAKITVTDSIIGDIVAKISGNFELANTKLNDIASIVINNSSIENLTLLVSNIEFANSTFNSIASITINNSTIGTLTALVENINVANSTFNSIASININNSTIGTLTAFVEGIRLANSTFNSIASININNSTIGILNALVENINIANSTFNNLQNITVGASTIGNLTALVTAISIANSTFNDIQSITVDASTIGNLTALVTAISIANSTFNDLQSITVDASTIGNLTALVTDISIANSIFNDLQNITIDSSTIDSLAAIVNAIDVANTTYNNIQNITVNSSTIDSLIAIVNAIDIANTTYNSIQSITVDASTIDSLIAIVNAIDVANTTYNSIQNITVDASTIGTLTAIINAIGVANSTYNSIQNITVDASTIGTLTALVENINAANSTFNNIQLINVTTSKVAGLDIVVSDINIVRSQFQQLRLINITTSKVAGLDIVVSDINIVRSQFQQLQLINITTSKVAGLDIVVSDINTVRSQFQQLRLINVTTSKVAGLDIVIDDVNEVFNQFNRLKDVAVVDPKTFDAKIDSLRTSITAASSLVSGITAVASVADFEKYAKAVPALLNNLVQIFNGIDVSKAEAFQKAASQFTSIVALFTVKTLTDIATYNDGLSTSAANTSTLIQRYDSLKTTLAGLTGTNGSLASLNSFFSNLVNDLKTKWDATVRTFNTNLSTAGVSVSITMPSEGVLSQADKANLTAIASNTKKYPIIRSLGTAGYTQATFAATGGYIQGPGTSTSDSVPARLSNGEYVLRASAVDRLGRPMLDVLNATGDISSALGSAGRRGDTLVAHINEREATALKRMGGSGSRNPTTGLLEFFNADAGAIGKLFAQQEAQELYNTFGSINTLVNSASAMDVAQNRANGDFISSANVSDSGIFTSGSPTDGDSLWVKNPNIGKNVNSYTANIADLISKSLGARNYNISSFKNHIGAEKQRSWYGSYTHGYNGITINNKNESGSGDPPIFGTFDHKDRLSMNPFYNRGAQALDVAANKIAGVSQLPDRNQLLSVDILKQYIDRINEGDRGNFTDFYMLKSISKKPYTYAPFTPKTPIRGGGEPGEYGQFGVGTSFPGTDPSNYNDSPNASGGLVTRDRVKAILEPGEFVLRKQAVDRMGLDAAIRLNSTGEAGGDIDVEVNIVNNGTAQNVLSTPEVRRENGKIIVDIILDDLRNNGPIKRQIRSIR